MLSYFLLSDEENNSEIVNGSVLPESVVQTNIRQQKNKPTFQRTMITRSLSNMSNSSGKNSSKPYYPGEDKSFMMARKTSTKGRKNNRRMSPSTENPVFINMTMVVASDTNPTISWIVVIKKKTPSRESSFIQNNILSIIFCRTPRFSIFPRFPERRNFLGRK